MRKSKAKTQTPQRFATASGTWTVSRGAPEAYTLTVVTVAGSTTYYYDGREMLTLSSASQESGSLYPNTSPDAELGPTAWGTYKDHL